MRARSAAVPAAATVRRPVISELQMISHEALISEKVGFMVI